MPTYVSHLSAQQPKARKVTRIFGPKRICIWPQGPQSSPPQRSRKDSGISYTPLMLPSKARFSRSQFSDFLAHKGISVVFNRLGTLKYLPSPSTQLSVVTSSKAAKKAVDRNKLRRRIYTAVSSSKPLIQGIVYAAKQSYGFSHDEVKSLTLDLLAKASKTSVQPSK